MVVLYWAQILEPLQVLMWPIVLVIKLFLSMIMCGLAALAAPPTLKQFRTMLNFTSTHIGFYAIALFKNVELIV
jgi:hypothetical protein